MAEQDCLLPVYDRLPVSFERAEGCYLYDEDDNRYLDGLAGIAVNLLGYRHPRLVDRLRRSATDVHHVSNLFQIKEQEELARRLSEIGFESAAFFCNSGAEANEAAIKFARRYSGRFGSGGKKIISFENSFHGRTLGALSATGQKKYQKGFSPLVEGFVYTPYNDLAALEEEMDDQICAVIMEPVQGEGGVLPASAEFFAGVRRLCNEYEALLILDEVQTGMARTGEYFCYQNYDLEPDLVTLAKGLGGGYPIGALLVERSLREGLQAGEHASTFGGNPFVCRMALTVLDVIEQEQLLASARARGEQLQTGLQELAQKYKFVDEPRGVGLMRALPLADQIEASELMRSALDAGLVVGVAGENALRFVPPLIITEQEVEELLSILDKVLQEN